jgi:hypothetical protein
MPQFGGMHVALPLAIHYSSWASRLDKRAPLVSVSGGRVLVVSVGDVNQRVSKPFPTYQIRVYWVYIVHIHILVYITHTQNYFINQL